MVCYEAMFCVKFLQLTSGVIPCSSDFLMSKFGEIIRELRVAQNLELRETAHLVGIAPVYLSRIERGKEAPPSEAVVRALAKLLATDADVLLRLCPAPDTQVAALLQQHPNLLGVFQLLLDRDLSDEQVTRVERFIRREVLNESSVSTV
jgi:HTH-type transcriptional regulator, competence development regulator